MTRAALCLAALLACAALWRAPSPRQRTVAGALVALLAIDVGRPFAAAWPAVYVAGFSAWYAVTAGAVWRVLKSESPAERGRGFRQLETPRRQGTPILLALAILASSLLAVRFGRTAELARASFALALAAQLVTALRFAARGVAPDAAQRVALVLAASSLADAVALWSVGAPARDWYVGRAISVATWCVVVLAQAHALARKRGRP